MINLNTSGKYVHCWSMHPTLASGTKYIGTSMKWLGPLFRRWDLRTPLVSITSGTKRTPSHEIPDLSVVSCDLHLTQ
jgi:hypothetical protein